MPTELEELVDFISHGNSQVRQLAVENLVPYSTSQPLLFKTNHLLPVEDLKLLIRDYEPIAKDAITILINLSTDQGILEFLATDKKFLNALLNRITNSTEPNANLLSMLLANLAKSDAILSILTLTSPVSNDLESSNLAINQLLDLFVKGADGSYNKKADYDYLSYLFADLAKHSEGRSYLLAKQDYDDLIPLSKLIVFTEHKSDIRRRGVASTIKNVAFEIEAHPELIDEDTIAILPYILLPIMGNEEYDEEDMNDMLPELQLLPPDKKRDEDHTIVYTHLETLMLLTTTRHGRETLRRIKTYPIVRETHLRVENDDVRETCDRLVQVLMRDEEVETKIDREIKALPATSQGANAGNAKGNRGSWAESRQEDSDDDDKIVEV